MRLHSIKLAGFKSFVDPTTVQFPGNLSAVVGPNGSGKSNIIDAVRWVMGESSAKYLRGESMTDVIFNGSTGRKPVGQASIELNFDNSEGKLGGQYASYNQISVKRVVNRDAVSAYYLNGQRCRRKDITDLFLGTGLGPRSYAIIMQDTISRLIEAKPEELRVYLEEVAGIAKYKERRRETENRIKHTRENLDRLNDLREELEKQINHLQRQAKAAERYKEYKEQQRLVKAQLHVLRLQALEHARQQQKLAVEKAENEVAAVSSKLTSIDTELDQSREVHTEKNDSFNEVQGRYYSLGAEVAKTEQSIQHQQQRQQQLEIDHAQAKEALTTITDQLDEDQKQVLNLNETITTLEPEIEKAQQELDAAQQAYEAAQSQLHDWQIKWDEFNTRYASNLQQAQVEQTKIQHLEQKQQETKQRLEKLQIEHEKNNTEALANSLSEFAAKQQQSQQLYDEQQQRIAELNQELQQLRDNNQNITINLDDKRSELQQLRGRYASLEALQQAALGQKNEAAMDWLKQQNLSNQPRLAQQIQVDSGWEHAVETVLGNYLEAVCVDDVTSYTDELAKLQQGQLTLLNVTNNVSIDVKANSLAAKVNGHHSAKSLLSSIYVAADLSQAMSQLASLNEHESIITQSGIWLGKDWVRICLSDANNQGVIERQQELDNLAQQIETHQQQVEELQQTLLTGREQVQTFEANQQELQQQLRQAANQLAEHKTQYQVKQAEINRAQEQSEKIKYSLSEAQQSISEINEQIQLARESWQEYLQAAEQDSELRDELIEQRDNNRRNLDESRARNKQVGEQKHELSLKYHEAKTQLGAISENIGRGETNIIAIKERYESLQEMLAASEEPIHELKQELEIQLKQQLDIETELQTAKAELDSIDHHMRELSQQRHEVESAIQTARNQLEQLRVQAQTYEVKHSTIVEQLDEMQVSLEEIQQSMPEEANEYAWEEQLESFERKISRLGAINLAAIDEYAVVSERKTYLDSQNDDLVAALETLENAIRKIDKETRSRFKETYDKVNQHFGELFPKIFGGGSAYLELTGDDLLETGVAVMARPPGKRNSTIHLLSGGEKALTALALVFSLFQLNPAPFCLLDEVDAPLDDANIGRFCSLVKEMSKTVQFIFISHNKLAIEMATHLTGVTMREPGVSRLVAVDIDAAVEMAAA